VWGGNLIWLSLLVMQFFGAKVRFFFLRSSQLTFISFLCKWILMAITSTLWFPLLPFTSFDFFVRWHCDYNVAWMCYLHLTFAKLCYNWQFERFNPLASDNSFFGYVHGFSLVYEYYAIVCFLGYRSWFMHVASSRLNLEIYLHFQIVFRL